MYKIQIYDFNFFLLLNTLSRYGTLGPIFVPGICKKKTTEKFKNFKNIFRFENLESVEKI